LRLVLVLTTCDGTRRVGPGRRRGSRVAVSTLEP
jgi:hypothetical protein